MPRPSSAQRAALVHTVTLSPEESERWRRHDDARRDARRRFAGEARAWGASHVCIVLADGQPVLEERVQ